MENEKTSDERQLEKLVFEIEKLRAETDNLKSKIRYVPVLSSVVAILVFCFGVFSFYWQQKNAADLSKQSYEKNIELSDRSYNQSVELSAKQERGKFYEEQLKTYFDLSRTAAQISNSNDEKEIQKSYEHFLELCNSHLIIVNLDKPADNKRIWKAVNDFSDAFSKDKNSPTYKTELQQSGRFLSAVLRNSIIEFWKLPIEKYTFEKEKDDDFFK